MPMDRLTMHRGVRLFHSECPRCRTRCSFTREGDDWVVSCRCGRYRFPWSPGEELFAIGFAQGISDRSRVVPVVTRRGALRRGDPDPGFDRFHAIGLPEHQHRLRRHLRRCLNPEPILLDCGLRHRSSETMPAAVSPDDIASLVIRSLREALLAAGLRVCARYRARLDRADIRSAFVNFIGSLDARMARAESRMFAHWRRWRDGGMHSAVQTALLAPKVPEFPIRTTLNEEDERLAHKWPHGRDEDNHEWSERVRSARAAERAALAYYDSFPETRPVEDVSLTQLASAKDFRAAWRSCDLIASGRPIDVKNVRFESCSESPAQYFSEYLLQPKYYGDRPSPVTILGVRTRQNDKVFESQILGEWDASIERSLSERARSLSDAVSVRWIPSRQTPASVPGWLLEYRRSHYSPFRPAWVKAWTRIESRVDETPVPLWLAAIAAAHGCSADRLSLSVRPRVDRELLRMLSRLFGGHAPSRPSLVLFVLIWLSHAGRNGNLELAADTLQRGFWGHPCSRTGFTRPLGLHDPLEYVRSWMDIFVRLWQSDPSMFSRLRSLRLVARGLLRGKFEGDGDGDGEERTLVAYCGGCSRYPLVHGDVPACGCIRMRLRCPWCHYCDPSCSCCRRRPARPSEPTR